MSSVRRRRFLELRCTGKSTYEAYKAAGYKGSRHAAYQLLSDCQDELREMLEDRASELRDMAQTQLSRTEQLELLKLLHKFSPEEAPQ